MTFAGESVFKLSNEPGSLGLSCQKNGLALAGVPLLRRVGKRFERRPRAEVQWLIGNAYRADADVAPLMAGLDVVAQALNGGDMARAMIAGVQLRLPELDWHAAVRVAQAEAGLNKYSRNQPRDWHGRWTIDGGNGAPTIPVAFTSGRPESSGISSPSAIAVATNDGVAPPATAGAASAAPPAPIDAPTDDWVKLPPGQRIDELGDLLEWIVNSKPEEAPAIRAEILRIYFRAGDHRGGEALISALNEPLYDGPLSREQRAQLLQDYESYTRVDPAEMGRFTRDLAALVLLGPLAAVPEAAEITTATNVWELGRAARGRAIEARLGANLSPNFPVIDAFEDGVATSIKSVDLNAAVYQNEARLSMRIDRYVDQLAEFDGAERGNYVVRNSDIASRVLKLAIPNGSVTRAQNASIAAARARAKTLGVDLSVIPF